MKIILALQLTTPMPKVNIKTNKFSHMNSREQKTFNLYHHPMFSYGYQSHKNRVGTTNTHQILLRQTCTLKQQTEKSAGVQIHHCCPSPDLPVSLISSPASS